MVLKKRKALYIAISILCLLIVLYFFSATILTYVGEFLVIDEKPVLSDVVVVLNTGMEYYPRLIEAAELYQKGFVRKIVINGNRKTDVLRSLEKKGFQPCCPWYEDRVRILRLLGVSKADVIAISAEDAYDTVSEAKVVGKALIESGKSSIIITTSKYHTRRARHIWKRMYPNQLQIRIVASQTDPFSPGGWWKEGRQIRWVLAEYGAWLYLFWKNISFENSGN
jgi:uncharacterized SAM-binding protein YcdF (DUF218 family)